MQTQTILKLMPVGIYNNTVSGGAYNRIIRLAATLVSGAADPDIANRIEQYTKHVAGRFLEEFEKGDFKNLLKVLREDLRMWDIPFQSDPEKILNIFERNPDLFTYPVGGLMGVAQNHHKLYGLLADVIESLVLISVAKKPLDVIRRLHDEVKRANVLGSGPAINLTKEWEGIEVPTKLLKEFTYRYLDVAIKKWVAEGRDFTPKSLADFMDANPPESSKLPLKRKLDLVKFDGGMLLWTDLSSILKRMKRENSIEDVINAMFDSLIKENAIYWVKNVGTTIDWNMRARRLGDKDVPDTDPPANGRADSTKVLRAPKD